MILKTQSYISYIVSKKISGIFKVKLKTDGAEIIVDLNE
jgi:hypothetical protein